MNNTNKKSKIVKTMAIYCSNIAILVVFMCAASTSHAMNEDDFSNTKRALMQCSKKYLEEYGLKINNDQSKKFGNRSQLVMIAQPSGLDYCPPDDAIKLAVQLPFDLDEKCGKWHIVYHGTSCNAAFNIAKYGFDPERTRQGKAYGPGAYLTPSWNMATQWTCDDVRTNDGRVFGTVLQCRVRPGSFTEHPLTWIDPPVPVEVDSNKCEYVVKDPQDIVVYGILFKQDPHTIRGNATLK
jgi:hypothetical protein